MIRFARHIARPGTVAATRPFTTSPTHLTTLTGYARHNAPRLMQEPPGDWWPRLIFDFSEQNLDSSQCADIFQAISNNLQQQAYPITEPVRIRFDKNPIDRLNPAALQQFAELGYPIQLSMQQCQLKTLPSKLGFNNLVDLDLSHNRFEQFPEAVTQQKYLRTLNLSDNWLNAIPKSVGNLTGLYVLNLANNDLSCQLPEELITLPSLWGLDLRGNKHLKVENLRKLLQQNNLNHIELDLVNLPPTYLGVGECRIQPKSRPRPK